MTSMPVMRGLYDRFASPSLAVTERTAECRSLRARWSHIPAENPAHQADDHGCDAVLHVDHGRADLMTEHIGQRKGAGGNAEVNDSERDGDQPSDCKNNSDRASHRHLSSYAAFASFRANSTALATPSLRATAL